MLHCRHFPRVGAYWACALKGSGDRVEAIVAADSLMPPGSGRPFSEQDRLAAAFVVPPFCIVTCSDVPCGKDTDCVENAAHSAMRTRQRADVSMTPPLPSLLWPLYHTHDIMSGI